MAEHGGSSAQVPAAPAAGGGPCPGSRLIGQALRVLKERCQADAAGFLPAPDQPEAPSLIHLPRHEQALVARGVSTKPGGGLSTRLTSALRQAGYEAVLCRPAEWQRRRCGWVYLASRTAREFSPADRDLVGVFGQHVALVLGAGGHDHVEELKDSFLAGITHDLKTPLVPVVGLLRLMASGRAGEMSERQGEYIAICLRNLDKQLNLIEDLIDYARAKSGRVELTREMVDLREVVAGSLELLEVTARGRGVEVVADLGEEPLWLAADRRKLGRVLSNLFSNAVKFNHDDGRVEVRLFREGERATVEVADNGVGIAPEHLPRIFERFYKVDKSPGPGLGLSVVKMLVDLHGGQLSVESNPGQGTRFRVALGLEQPKGCRLEGQEGAPGARREGANDGEAT
jgi:signal transduction histidine kinase